MGSTAATPPPASPATKDAVIGNVTNLTARLSSVATGGEILISARVRGELGDSYRTEPAGELTLKGFHQPQAAYRVLDADTRQRAAV
jgi:class 3 adenylate cyclase